MSQKYGLKLIKLIQFFSQQKAQKSRFQSSAHNNPLTPNNPSIKILNINVLIVAFSTLRCAIKYVFKTTGKVQISEVKIFDQFHILINF